MIYGYIRVSTGKQTTENQKIVIREFCKKNSFNEIKWVDETISGTKEVKERKLGKLLKKLKKDDKLIITEISRLGRSILMIFKILNELMEKGIELYSIREGFSLGNNIQTKVIAFAFGLTAEIERQLLSERTKIGIERARISGKKLGRKNNKLPESSLKCFKHKNYIKKNIGKMSKSKIARRLHIARGTLERYVKEYL